MAQRLREQKFVVIRWVDQAGHPAFRQLLWKIIHSSQQEMREFETQNIGFLKFYQDGAQQPLNLRPDFAQAKRECKILHDEYLTRTLQEQRTILRSQQVRQRTEQAFKGIEEYDYAVEPRTGWRFFEQHEGKCRIRCHRPRQQIGTATIGRREIGILGILHGLTIREIVFLNFKDQFRLARRSTSRQPTGVDRTPITVHVQLITERSAQVPSREHAWLQGAQPRTAHCGT